MFLHRVFSRLPVVCMTLGCVLAVAGCQRQANLPPLAVTTGTVTYEGKPLATGTVTFFPDVTKGTTGPTGIGHIQKDGTYRIQTGQNDGAQIGHHLIGVRALSSDRTDGTTLIPFSYDDPATSGLTAEVKRGETNVVDLKLVAKP